MQTEGHASQVNCRTATANKKTNKTKKVAIAKVQRDEQEPQETQKTKKIKNAAMPKAQHDVQEPQAVEEPPEEGDGKAQRSGTMRGLHKHLVKTRMCNFFLQGKCSRGSACNFAHAPDELNEMPNLVKTQLCKAFTAGSCTDKTCTFAHGLQELSHSEIFFKKSLCRWYAKGNCLNGARCSFAHGAEDLWIPPEVAKENEAAHNTITNEAAQMKERYPKMQFYLRSKDHGSIYNIDDECSEMMDDISTRVADIATPMEISTPTTPEERMQVPKPIDVSPRRAMLSDKPASKRMSSETVNNKSPNEEISELCQLITVLLETRDTLKKNLQLASEMQGIQDIQNLMGTMGCLQYDPGVIDPGMPLPAFHGYTGQIPQFQNGEVLHVQNGEVPCASDLSAGVAAVLGAMGAGMSNI